MSVCTYLIHDGISADPLRDPRFLIAASGDDTFICGEDDVVRRIAASIERHTSKKNEEGPPKGLG